MYINVYISSGIQFSSFPKQNRKYIIETYKTLHQSMLSFLVTFLIKYLL